MLDHSSFNVYIMKKQFIVLYVVVLLTGLTPSLLAQVSISSGPGGGVLANSPTTNTAVGIRYNQPKVDLDVKDSLRVTSTGGTNYLTLTSPGAYHNIRATNNLGIIMDNNGRLDFTLGGSIRTSMLNTGQVGIGITTPSWTAQKLHVHDGSIMISGSNSSGGAMITFSDNVAANAYPRGRWGIEYVPNVGLNFWQPWNPTPGGGLNYAVLIKDDAKVGIGVDPTIPNSFPNGYRLYVRDGILTEKLKIAVFGTANWSDFVFADDYCLRPLSEVEDFIQQHKHLPDVPSAQALVDEGGVDVQVMLAKQMQKIEELTLYIIAQEKKIQALEEKVAR